MARDRHTFLFTDLVGFTALTEERGDDGGAEIALRFYERVRTLLAEHRAHEVKTIGDALMLRCEEPALAVRLGLRIVEELEAAPGFPPVRVGMHTGPAVERGGDWYGSTVNVAARLCAVTGGGQVLASEATCVAAGRVTKIDFHEAELHWLKNVSEPIGARLATRRRCVELRRRRLRVLKQVLAPRLEAAPS